MEQTPRRATAYCHLEDYTSRGEKEGKEDVDAVVSDNEWAARSHRQEEEEAVFDYDMDIDWENEKI
jgi:hypothetical protein